MATERECQIHYDNMMPPEEDDRITQERCDEQIDALVDEELVWLETLIQNLDRMLEKAQKRYEKHTGARYTWLK